ncbi:MAG: hypothetical protein ACKORJ_00155 [Bacteroidota bacterium]
MIRALASLVSWVLHPLLMPALMFLVIASVHPILIQLFIPPWWIFSVILVLTGILPALNLILFKMMGTISSLHLPERRDRIMPFMFITMVYLAVTYLFFSKYPSPSILRLMAIMSAVCAAGTVATLFIKVSIHAMASSAVTTVFLFILMEGGGMVMLIASAVSLMLTGLVMSARLTLDAHTPAETISGAALGSIMAAAGMLILF